MQLSSLLWPNHPYVDVFGMKIYWYAIIIVIGMLVAFCVISLLFKRRNMSPDLFLTLFCICLPIAIVFTRLFYCVTSGMPIADWFNFESIRNGGLSIIGGILGGAISILVVCLVKKIDFFRLADCVIVGVLFAQAIGRWGNFVNQEVYGMEVTNTALQFFPFAVYIESSGTWHYAFFFYESLVTFAAAILLFIRAWKDGRKPNGVNSACYLITYGLTRTIMEPLRDPTFILGKEESLDGIPWSMVFSILLLVAGIAMLVVVLYLNKKKEGKYFGSETGEAYGIAEYIRDNKNETAYLSSVNMMCAVYPENYVKPASKKDLDWIEKTYLWGKSLSEKRKNKNEGSAETSGKSPKNAPTETTDDAAADNEHSEN